VAAKRRRQTTMARHGGAGAASPVGATSASRSSSRGVRAAAGGLARQARNTVHHALRCLGRKVKRSGGSLCP